MTRFLFFLFLSGLYQDGWQGTTTAFVPCSQHQRELFGGMALCLSQKSNQDNIKHLDVIPPPREPEPPAADVPGIDHVNPIPESMQEPSVNPTNADSDVPGDNAGSIPDWPSPVSAPRIANHDYEPSDCPGLPPPGMESLPPSIQEPNVF